MTPSTNKNAVIYCRVSTKEQVEEGNSLTTQERNCREYALKHNYNVLEVFIEQGESAKTADRTELQNLLTFCHTKKNNVHAVIIYKIDRLSRNTDDYSHLRILLKRYGVEIKSTSEYFENTPAGRFMENIIANVAQFDNDVRTERSVGGMKQAVLEGRYVWGAPLGYINTKVGGKANIAPTEKSQFVQEAFAEVARGFYSVNQIRLKLADKGFVQKDGKSISKALFYRMLNNELYAGWIIKFGERHKGTFDPIISNELFEAVQRRLRSKSKHRVYLVENPAFPLRRFVLSPDGEKLTGSWSQGKLKKYAYYRFVKANKEFPKHRIESRFVSFLNQYAIEPQYFEILSQKIKAELREMSQKVQILKKSLLQKQKMLHQRKQLLIDKSLSGVISDTVLKEQLDRIEDELWKIFQAVNESPGEQLPDGFEIENFRQLATKPGEFWLRQSFEVKKELQVFEFPQGVIFDGHNFRTPEICSLFKLNHLFSSKEYSNVDYPRPTHEHSINTKYSPPLQRKGTFTQELLTTLMKVDAILHPNPTAQGP